MKKQILSMHQIKTRVVELFTMSRICGSSASDENERIARQIWDELNRMHGGNRADSKRLRPVYSTFLKGYARGLIDSQRDSNYAQHLEYCYVASDGTRYSTRKGAERSTEEFFSTNRGALLARMANGHFWIATGKPYFIGQLRDTGERLIVRIDNF